MSNKPVYKSRIGYVECAVFENDGFYTAVLSRTYKKEGGYHSTNQLGHADIPAAILCLQRCEEYISRDK